MAAGVLLDSGEGRRQRGRSRGEDQVIVRTDDRVECGERAIEDRKRTKQWFDPVHGVY
jgi:hypothetical protein